MAKTQQLVAVAELDQYGLKVININLIEEYLGIIYLADLLKLDPAKLPDMIPNFGDKALAQIKKAVKAAGLKFIPEPKKIR